MNTYWRADGMWGCSRHLVSKFPATLKRCYYSDCENRCTGRPELKNRPNVYEACSLVGCENEKRSGSKYCSDECRKTYARTRYIERKRRNQNGLQQVKG